MSTGAILALGGGGARGLAHLGVLQVLREQGIHPAGIVGTSMGAVMAALYGAGIDLDRMEDLAEVFPWQDMLDIQFHRGLGLIGVDRMQAVLALLTKGKTFAQLSLPVWVVATDLETGAPVILRDGPVAQAVAASAAVPGVFAPVGLGGRLLVDGGVVAGVPVEIALEMGRPVVAVDVGSDFPAVKPRNILGVLAQVVRIMGSNLDRRQVARADLVIRPEVGGLGTARFDQARQCVAWGREAAVAALPALRSLLQKERRTWA
ncbi:MAG: patatin-like phospholipase family protein [Patescibacteria group bacterium]